MIFDIITGGDLFNYINKKENNSEVVAKYYGAQILIAL